MINPEFSKEASGVRRYDFPMADSNKAKTNPWPLLHLHARYLILHVVNAPWNQMGRIHAYVHLHSSI
jgi:hypothetical protein